jgi:hypothetical protein
MSEDIEKAVELLFGDSEATQQFISDFNTMATGYNQMVQVVNKLAGFVGILARQHKFQEGGTWRVWLKHPMNKDGGQVHSLDGIYAARDNEIVRLFDENQNYTHVIPMDNVAALEWIPDAETEATNE